MFGEKTRCIKCANFASSSVDLWKTIYKNQALLWVINQGLHAFITRSLCDPAGVGFPVLSYLLKTFDHAVIIRLVGKSCFKYYLKKPC
jgi:hypothetical protein